MRLFFVVCLLCWSVSGWAQELSFVPPGVWQVSMSQNSESWSRTHRKQKTTEPNALRELDLSDSSAAKLKGGLDYTQTRQVTGVRYGLNSKLNLGFLVSSQSLERVSTLENLDSTNQSVTDYVAAVNSRKVSGAGDTEIFLDYRHMHSDYALLVSGLYLSEPTGKTEYNQTHPMNLGTGLRRLGYRLIWDGYISGSTLYLHSLFQIGFDSKAQVPDLVGGTQTLKGGVGNKFRSEVLHQLGWLHYGTGIQFIVEPDHKLADRSIRDGMLGTSVWLTAGLGNLSKLEQGPVSLPWTFSMQASNSYSGTNLPMALGLKAKLSVYF